MNHSKARWRLKNLLRMALSTQLCLSLLIVHSPVAQARRVIPPGFDPIVGEKGSLYKINRAGEIIFGSEQMKYADLKPDEKSRLFHLAYSSEDEGLTNLARELATQESEIMRNQGGCSLVSGWLGCDEEEKAKKLEEATKLADMKLNELNQAAKSFYGEHEDYIDDLKQFPTYQFMGINDAFSRSDKEVEANLPPYCQNYPSMGITNYKEYMGESHDNELLFSTCIDEKTPFVVSVGNLVDDYAKIEAFNYQKGVDLFNRELANASMQKILETRNAYMSTSPAAFSDSEKETLAKLNSCLGDNAKDGVAAESSLAVQKTMSELTAKEDALSDEEKKGYKHAYNQSNLKNTVISAALFNLQKVEMATIEGERDKVNRANMACINKAGGGPAPRCYQEQKKALAALDKREKEQEALTLGPISLLYKKDPTLFTEINHREWFDWNNHKPAPSELAQKIAGNPKSGELINLIQEAINANPGSPVSAAEAVLAEHMDLFQEATSAIEQDRTIQNLSANATKNHVNELTKSALKLCQGDVEQLHHFPDLYADVMQNIAASGGPNSKEKIMQMQGAYCYLLRKDPPNEKSGFTLLQGIGLGLVVIGAVAQIIPIAGTAVGTALILGGGALTTIDAAKKVNARLSEQASQNAVLAAGWSDYKAKLEAQNAASDAWADLGIETAFIAVDVVTVPFVAAKMTGAIGRVKKTSAVAKGSTDEIIEIAAAHGDGAAEEAMRLKKLATTTDESKSATAAIHSGGEDISGEMIRAQRAAAAKASELDPASQAIIDAAAKGDDMAEDLMTAPHITSTVDSAPETLRVADDALPTRVADQVTPTQIDEVKVSENLPVVKNQSTEVSPIESTANEILPVETKNVPTIKGQTADATTLNPVKTGHQADVVKSSGTDVATFKPRPGEVIPNAKAEVAVKVIPDEVKAVDGVVLKAKTSGPSTALTPANELKHVAQVSEAKSVMPVQRNEAFLLTKPKISQVDEAADIVASVRSDIARRPATSGKIDFAAKLSKNSDGLIDDFMQALSGVPTSTRNRLLEHIDKGHFAPEELSKIMDEAVASLRKACQ